MELDPAELAPRDPRRRGRRRLITSGIVGIMLGLVAVNLLFGANERESRDHPPHWGEFYAGVVLMAAAAPFVAVAFRAQGSAHALAWIGAVLVLLAFAWAVGILMQPPF